VAFNANPQHSLTVLHRAERSARHVKPVSVNAFVGSILMREQLLQSIA